MMSSRGPSMAPEPFSYDDDDARWRAVRARDVCADGLFVYAVQTTRIYCRPVCKACLARRANVRFFPAGLAAEAAGFRACKRCRPDAAGFMPEERAVRQMRAFAAAPGRDVAGMSLGQMAARTGLSKWHFHRVFKESLGLTPREFARACRRRMGSGAVESLQNLGLHGGEPGVLEQPLVHPGTTAVGENAAAYGEVVNTSPSGLSPLPLNGLPAWTEDDLLAWTEDDLLAWPEA